jgi:hypothetical protein
MARAPVSTARSARLSSARGCVGRSAGRVAGAAAGSDVVAAAAWVGSLRGQVNHNAYAAAQFSAKIKARRMVRASTFPAPLATLSP